MLFIKYRDFIKSTFYVPLVLTLLTFSVAAAETTTFTYEVIPGDNLTFIANRFGITVKSLQTTNKLTSDVLSIGQELRFINAFQKTSPKKIQWNHACPQTGKILRPFGKYKDKNILMARTGTDLSCPVGSKVKAPATAVVRYIGPLDGFGTVLILEHFDGFTTIYSPMDEATMKVQEGSAINKGQLLGKTAQPILENSPPYLHIELRKDQIAIKPNALHP